MSQNSSETVARDHNKVASQSITKAMMATWGETSDEEDDSQEEEAAVALVARSESESDFEPVESLSQLKDKVRGLSKAKVEKLLLTVMDECDAINAENCMLKDVCSKLKMDVTMFERNKQELERVNEILKCEKFKADEKTLTVRKDLDTPKDLMNTREKVFNTDLSRLESESLDLKLMLESLVSKNNQLLEKAHKAESNFAQNRRWNSSSEALNWLNTHHS